MSADGQGKPWLKFVLPVDVDGELVSERSLQNETNCPATFTEAMVPVKSVIWPSGSIALTA